MHPCPPLPPPPTPTTLRMHESVSMDALYEQQENIYIAKAKHLIKFRATSRARVNMDIHSCHVCVCVWDSVSICMYVTEKEPKSVCVLV